MPGDRQPGRARSCAPFRGFSECKTSVAPSPRERTRAERCKPSPGDIWGNGSARFSSDVRVGVYQDKELGITNGVLKSKPMEAARPAVSYPHVVTDSQVMSGRPCIAGTRVRVMDIVAAYRAGVPDEQLQEYFATRTLTLSEIHSALAYYYGHQEEIDAAFAEDEELGRRSELERRGFERSPDEYRPQETL